MRMFMGGWDVGSREWRGGARGVPEVRAVQPFAMMGKTAKGVEGDAWRVTACVGGRRGRADAWRSEVPSLTETSSTTGTSERCDNDPACGPNESVDSCPAQCSECGDGKQTADEPCDNGS